MRVVLGACVPAAKTHPKYKEERDVRNLKEYQNQNNCKMVICVKVYSLGFMFTVEVGKKKERKKEKNTSCHWDSCT